MNTMLLTCAWLFCRGALQLMPVSMSTVFISRGKYGLAGMTSFAISVLWWFNAGSASSFVGVPYAVAYGGGAMLGTVLGMFVARRIAKIDSTVKISTRCEKKQK
jgi:hypothetical protein